MMWSKLNVGNEMAKVLAGYCSFINIRAEQLTQEKDYNVHHNG